LSKTGGLVVVCEYYRLLRRAGHDVSIVYPLWPYRIFSCRDDRGALENALRRLAVLVKNLLMATRTIKWHFDEVPVRPVLTISPLFVRESVDVAIATAWPTAYSIMKLQARRKLYLVQGYETWGGSEEQVKATYRLPLEIVTVSPWLTRIMQRQFGRRDVCEVHNGVRLSVFTTPKDKDYSRLKVFMIYSPLTIKGCAFAVEALTSLLDECPTAEVCLAGICDFEVPDGRMQKLIGPGPELLVRQYQEASIFLFPTIEEGWGMPALEAMACGCAVISTRAGSMEVLYDGHNALIVRPASAHSILRGLRLLACSEERRRALGTAAAATAKKHSWERSATRLESFLCS
jgi:hypothetical protein